VDVVRAYRTPCGDEDMFPHLVDVRGDGTGRQAECPTLEERLMDEPNIPLDRLIEICMHLPSPRLARAHLACQCVVNWTSEEEKLLLSSTSVPGTCLAMRSVLQSRNPIRAHVNPHLRCISGHVCMFSNGRGQVDAFLNGRCANKRAPPLFAVAQHYAHLGCLANVRCPSALVLSFSDCREGVAWDGPLGEKG
jgi:hypothetical protein